MYGTVARMRLKPGAEAKMTEVMRQYETLNIPGQRATYVYRMDNDPNAFMMAVIFDDKASYVANANSPEQNARYQEMVALLEGPPEWHDGEIVYP
jgi:quinol monooxygenase YgiN